MIEIKEIQSPDEKSGICNAILRALPDWFAVEASILDYAATTREMPFYAAFDDDKTVGFVAVKRQNRYTAEICVMGIRTEYHRRGIGRLLIECCECYCKANGMEFLTVKTLDESAESKSYERTRKFYCAMGFRPLEVFPLYWDEANPCLFMAKHVTTAKERR